jgi:hypothetical protein
MVEAAKTIAFNPTNGQLSFPMGAAKADDVGCSALASIEREILSENTNGHRVAGCEFMGAKNRLPEHPQVFSCQGLRAGAYEIQMF